MIFDNGACDKYFIESAETNQSCERTSKVNVAEDSQIQQIESNSISPSSLPELNVIHSPSSQRQSTDSPNAINSPIEEESTKKILKCDYCDKTFTLANVLKVHQRIHTGEKPYVCEICGKAFNQSGSLNRHRNTHRYRDSTDNNFICRFCNAKFPHGSLLETHEKSAHHNRRSGRPRNLSSVDNSTASLDGKVGESFSKFSFTGQHEMKHDQMSPLTIENGDPKNDSTGNRDHTPIGGNGEYAFTCPYCQLGVNDLRELGIHLSHHNLSNGLVSGSSGINSPTNPMISKNNPLFSSDSLVHQLTSLSKKLKIPSTSEFNHNLGLGSVPTSSFMPISFDRLRPTDNIIPNINFHLPNSNSSNLAANPPVLSEPYNLAAFVLATLSKDYLYKQRTQPPPSHQENGFPVPSSEFLKNHIFNQKPSLLGPLPNANNLDFYNLFNLQKPLHSLLCNIDNGNGTSVVNNIENDQPLERHENNYNGVPMTNPSTTTFPMRLNAKEPLAINDNAKSSITRSSPASSGNTTQSSSNKTADIFFSRKNGGERRKCPDCDKQFTCESALRIHYRKHSGERPYACEFCSKTFSQNGTLKRHHLTCKNRPSILSNNKIKSMNTKSSMSQDPDSTQEVNNSSTTSNYGPSNSPTYPTSHPLSYILNTKTLNTNINETLTKFEHFTNKPIFQPVLSYSSENASRKTSDLRSPYNHLGSSEEPTDLTINGSRNEETVSQSFDEETHLDIDSMDDNKMLIKIEENNNCEDMDATELKINTPSDIRDSNSNHYIFNREKNIIYNFSTKEILAHLVENGRLLMCRHCLIYFENEKTYNGHITSHIEEKSNLECRDCKFVAKDEGAFKDHFNNMNVLSNDK